MVNNEDMTRAIWKAFIQFGPVSVPVKLYTAVKDVRPHSHLLHDDDRPYYVVPREGGERSYQLLVEVMQETHKAGLAKFVLHDREHLVALWAQNDVLSLMMLHFPEEVADTDEIRPKEARPQAARVGATTAAIQQLRGDYDPAKYVDEHRERVLGYLQEKAKQQGTVEVAAPEAAEEQAVEQEGGQDLVTTLEESLARARARS